MASAAAATVFFLGATLYNGYPMAFSDTYAYVTSAFTLRPPIQRPIFYGYLINFTTIAGRSLWPIVTLQAMLVAYGTHFAVKRHTDWDPAFVVLFGFGLAWGTSLPWFVGQIMPDIFAGIMGLALYALLFRWRSLSLVHRICLFSTLAIAVLTHLSHYLIAFLTIGGAFIYQRFCTSLRLDVRPFVGALLIIGGCSLISRAVNHHFTGKASLSRVGHAFIMGRLAQDGIIYRLLRDHCEEARYSLCSHLDRMAYMSPDSYLWGERAMIRKIGGWDGSREESWRMIKDSLRYYPGAHLWSATRATVRQFMTFATGHELTVFRANRARPAITRNFPEEAPQYLGARQINGRLRPQLNLLGPWHRRFVLFSLLVLVAVTLYAPRSPQDVRRSLIFAPYALIFLLANAAVSGVFSGVYDRYQSRVIWLAPLAAMVSLRELLSCLYSRWRAPKNSEPE